MSNPFLYAWQTVETGCRDYLNTALGTIEGIQGFTEQDWPRTVPSNGDDFFIWRFGINGGGEVVQRNSRATVIGGAWHMDAEFMAICSTDAVALAVAGLVIDALPATSADVTGLARLYFTEWPSRQRIVQNLLNDENAGQEQIFYELRIPMSAAFSNTAQ